MFGVTILDRVTNECIRRAVKMVNVTAKIQEPCLRWYEKRTVMWKNE